MLHSAGAPQNSAKFVAKGGGAKISIFDVLSSGPTSAFISTGTESVGPVQGPVNQVKELEWGKAGKGELQEKVEPDVVAQYVTIKQEEESINFVNTKCNSHDPVACGDHLSK